MSKVLCLLSGGLDSTTCLYKAVADGNDVTALHFAYDHPAVAQEFIAASELAMLAGVPFINIPLEGIEYLQLNSYYLPSRNLIFLSYAYGIAFKYKFNEIWFGAYLHDRVGFPDTTPEFIASFEAAAQKGVKKDIKIITPFVNSTKKEIVEIAKRLNVPIEKTYSCYEAEECGVCLSCVERKKALEGFNP